MIELTRLNGSPLAVNCDLIKYAEASPDTVLTLVTGEKLVVLEPCDEVSSAPSPIAPTSSARMARRRTALTANLPSTPTKSRSTDHANADPVSATKRNSMDIASIGGILSPSSASSPA